MTHGRHGRLVPSLAIAAVACLAASCSTSPDQEIAVAPGRSGTPTDTGTFPNLNIPQRAATAQLTPEETQAQLASLRAAAQQQQSPAGEAEAAEARRKRLQVLQAEQAETLKVIESE